MLRIEFNKPLVPLVRIGARQWRRRGSTWKAHVVKKGGMGEGFNDVFLGMYYWESRMKRIAEPDLLT